ncbi:hypothetical protein [Collinsella ihumii]|uniref:Four helix bundle protein n=1 Tax=Collinsella ihumii TaxID=1720204 RepID=A0ABT7XFK9_9ACTN|nr:hypothetical protein [Collinsella ihumii]MDN0055614.1 hypothetical protein [Collinsella ihumii]MDN0064197.1 hypothetical protein [Collinsella ihumii]
MSGVYMRNRHLSSYEFFNTAVALRTAVTRLATSSAVPKSHRFVLSVPMAETARSLVYNLVKSDAFYPNTEHGVQMRKHFMTLAMADCDQLDQDVQLILALGLPVRPTQFEPICEMIATEIALIKGARDRVKLIGSRQGVKC